MQSIEKRNSIKETAKTIILRYDPAIISLSEEVIIKKTKDIIKNAAAKISRIYIAEVIENLLTLAKIPRTEFIRGYIPDEYIRSTVSGEVLRTVKAITAAANAGNRQQNS